MTSLPEHHGMQSYEFKFELRRQRELPRASRSGEGTGRAKAGREGGSGADDTNDVRCWRGGELELKESAQSARLLVT